MANINFGGNNDNDRNNGSRSRHNRDRHNNEQVLFSGGEQKNGLGWGVKSHDNGGLFSIGGIISLFSAIKKLKAGKPEDATPEPVKAEDPIVEPAPAPLPAPTFPSSSPVPPVQQGQVPPIAPPPVFRAPPLL